MNQQMNFSFLIKKIHSRIDEIIVKVQKPRWIIGIVIQESEEVERFDCISACLGNAIRGISHGTTGAHLLDRASGVS